MSDVSKTIRLCYDSQIYGDKDRNETRICRKMLKDEEIFSTNEKSNNLQCGNRGCHGSSLS